jgi:hypothetical protein
VNKRMNKRSSGTGSQNDRSLHFTDQPCADEVARLLDRSAGARGDTRAETRCLSQTSKEPALLVGPANRTRISDPGVVLSLSKTFCLFLESQS